MSKQELQTYISRACILEASARKPGNVHPAAAFEDLQFSDFLISADAVASAFILNAANSVGAMVFAAIQATQQRLERSTNPNLGIVLLLAPLLQVPRETPLIDGINAVLDALTVDDARQVYAAIRLSNPGGMGQVESADVSSEPAVTLREAMRLAADRDSIAAEYTYGYPIILGTAVPFLAQWPDFERDWENAILHLQFTLMSRIPDSLIARKCGVQIAEESARKAAEVLDLGGMRTEPGRAAVRQFDHWLRADGHRRNPGTTADLIAASLFAAARDDMITLPIAFPHGVPV